MPPLVYSARGDYHCKKFDLGLKGHQREKVRGIYSEKMPLIWLHNKAQTHTCMSAVGITVTKPGSILINGGEEMYIDIKSGISHVWK